MARSQWKGPYLEKIDEYSKFKTIKLWKKNLVILPHFVGLNFNLYNGKSFFKLTISEDMIGHKFGEFLPTRKKFSFKKKS